MERTFRIVDEDARNQMVATDARSARALMDIDGWTKCLVPCSSLPSHLQGRPIRREAGGETGASYLGKWHRQRRAACLAGMPGYRERREADGRPFQGIWRRRRIDGRAAGADGDSGGNGSRTHRMRGHVVRDGVAGVRRDVVRAWAA